MRRRFLALVGLALVAAAPAAADDIGKKVSVDARIAALQARIDASKDQEGVLSSQLSEVATELQDAQAAVETAQVSVDSLEAELASARARLDGLSELLAAQTTRLERLQAEYARAVTVLEARVRAAYMDEPPDMLSFLVSASTFDDLVDNVDFLERIGRQDQRVTAAVDRAKRNAAAERATTIRTRRLQEAAVSVIGARTEAARAARDWLAADRDRLATVESLKQVALADTRQTRAEYLGEVESLAAESAVLAARIRAAQAGASSTGTGLPSEAGLIWPCEGVVVSGFGMRWGRLHEGIDIACAYGAPVHAAAAGTVIYAGWMQGYGNLVVLDHGNGVSTAYAHASAILVSLRQTVGQGDEVSLVGATGHATGPHLHFEVRVNGVAVDPLSYL
jgi:murein DD-endopeptidase MepM/ murein hydrolase activator NlpD